MPAGGVDLGAARHPHGGIDAKSLELIPGDDELSKRLNANFDRINGLLFGPQDYAIVATR